MPLSDPSAIIDGALASDDFDGIPVTVIGRLSLLSRVASSYGMYAVLYVEEDESPTPRIRYTGCIKSDDVDFSLLVLINETENFNQGIKAAHLALECYYQKGLPFEQALVSPLIEVVDDDPQQSREV